MTEKELRDLLTPLQLAGGVWYDHVLTSQGAPANIRPFILIVVNNVETKKGDDMVIYQENDYIIEFCSEALDTTTEGLIEKILNDNHLPYDKTRDFIDSEQIYQTSYTL